MSFKLKTFLLKRRGYRFVRLIHYEDHRGSPITEAIYRNPAGTEKRVLVGRFAEESEMQ